MKKALISIGIVYLAIAMGFAAEVSAKVGVLQVWNKDNVDQIKDLLPPSLYMRVKDWGLTLREIPYQKFEYPKEFQEATKKYSSQVKLGQKGELSGWVAGIPFPNPSTGIEIMWNHEKIYYGDNYFWDMEVDIVNSQGQSRHIQNTYSRYNVVGRIHDPRGTTDPEAERGIQFKELTIVTGPYELRDLGFLQVRYLDQSKDDDFWVYVPSLRRVRRASAGLKMDQFAGTDLAFDDFLGFNGRVSENTYRLIGQKELLLARHSPEKPKREGLQIVNLYYEKTKAYVVEAYPTSPQHIYSKRVFYIDPESWYILYVEAYDKAGRLWKIVEWPWDHTPYQAPGSPDQPGNFGFIVIDVQARHASFWATKRHDVNREDLELSQFSTSYLKSLGK